MQTLALKIVTPEGVVLEEEVARVTLPVEEGEVTILPQHMPYIGSLGAGEAILIHADETQASFALSGGFVEFDHNTLTVLADTAERAEAIDIERAEAAKQRAEELRSQAADMSEEEYARVAAALEKELVRIKVARKHASRRGPQIISE